MDIPVALDRPAVGSNLQDHIDYVSSWQSGSRVPIGNSREGTLRMLGAIVGKALEDFDGPGTGIIRVMVSPR